MTLYKGAWTDTPPRFTEANIHAYQHTAIDRGLERPKLALFSGMGTGKTMIAQSVMEALLSLGDMNRVLVIAPKMVATNGWHQEAARWEHLRNITFSVVMGTIRQRTKALNEVADVYITNLETVSWLVDHYGRDAWPFDALIVDESQYFKDNSTGRFKSLQKIVGDVIAMREGVPTLIEESPVKRTIIMTGTPRPSTLENLWSQIYLLDGGKRLGGSLREFRLRYMHQNGWNKYKWFPNDRALDQVLERIKDISIVIRTEDHVELPPIIYRDHIVEMPKDALDQYAEMKREFLLEFDSEEGGSVDEATAPNAAALAGKLQQITNGAIYPDREEGDTTPNSRREYKVVHDAKLDALKQIVEDARGVENLIVCYWFQHDKRRIEKAIPEAVTLDAKGTQIEPWNEGKIPVLLLHPLRGGVGTNLQMGGSLMVFFSMIWSLGAYLQTIARVYRMGQLAKVRIIHLVTRGTIEERISEVLQGNLKEQDEFVEKLLHKERELG